MTINKVLYYTHASLTLSIHTCPPVDHRYFICWSAHYFLYYSFPMMHFIKTIVLFFIIIGAGLALMYFLK